MEFTDALRKMTLLDDEYVDALLGGDDPGLEPAVGACTLTLVRIAALAGSGASMHSYAAEVDGALAAGVSPSEIVGVLAAIAPIIGSAALACAAQPLALALGYDTELALEGLESPPQPAPKPSSRARATASLRDDTPNLR